MDEEEWVNNGFYCTLCAVETTCMANFRDHLNGKSHKNTVTKIKALMSDKEDMPDIMQWYTKEDVEEYGIYGITRSMLQEASIDSSEYETKLDPEQIGKTTADPNFFCKLCQVQTTSLGNFRDHLNGKSHKSMMAKYKDGGVLPPPKPKKNTNTVPSGVKPESIILQQVKDLQQPVLGLDFITEFHTVGRIVCVCNICASKFDSNAAVSHTTGRKHRLHYLKEKQQAHYNHAKRYGGKKSQLAAFLEEILPEIERTDGRGVPQIKIYENENLCPGVTGVFDEEERRRQMKVASLGSGFKIDYDEWINSAVNKAAATRKDDDFDPDKERLEIKTEPKPVKQDKNQLFLKSLLENDAIGDQKIYYNQGHTSHHRFDHFERSRSPLRKSRGHSPGYVGRRSRSPAYKGHRSRSPANSGRRSPPAYITRSPIYYRPRSCSPNTSELNIKKSPIFHQPDYSQNLQNPGYVGEGPSNQSSNYIGNPYGYNAANSSSYFSHTSSNVQLDPLKRPVRPSETREQYIVPPSYDNMYRDPTKRFCQDFIDHANVKKEIDPVCKQEDEWEKNIQDILRSNKSIKGNDSLSLLNTYISPEQSPSPSKRRHYESSDKEKLPFEKSYIERESEKKRRDRKRQSRSPRRSRSPRGKRSTRRSRSPRDKRRYSRSPKKWSPPRRPASPFRGFSNRTQMPPRRRSPRRTPSPKRRTPSPKRRISSPKRRISSPKRRAASPKRWDPSQKRRASSPKRRSPSPYTQRTIRDLDMRHKRQTLSQPSTSKDDLASALNTGDGDAQAEAIANLLVEMGQNTGGNLDPHQALKALLSNPEVAELLSGNLKEEIPSPPKTSKTKVTKKSRHPVAFGLSSGNHRDGLLNLLSVFKEEDEDS